MYYNNTFNTLSVYAGGAMCTQSSDTNIKRTQSSTMQQYKIYVLYLLGMCTCVCVADLMGMIKYFNYMEIKVRIIIWHTDRILKGP